MSEERKNIIKKIMFWLTFSKDERAMIREGLMYGEDVWFASFEESKYKLKWMNDKRNEFSFLRDQLK